MGKHTILSFSGTSVCVSPFQSFKTLNLPPKTCYLSTSTSSRHVPVMNCRPEPPCVVTDIPKRVNVAIIPLDCQVQIGYAGQDQIGLFLKIELATGNHVSQYHL